MTIKNRYLKYFPEITLEIFTLVWNKLIEYRFKQKYGYNLNNEFECFKNNHNYLIIEDDFFNTYLKSCIFDNVEITVQEILGYDPFVKEEFILPEKWVIKVTTDNLPELKKCDKLNKTVGYPYSINGYYGSTTHGDAVVPKDYTEITFEQFKKYVLCSDKNLVPLPGFDN